MLDAVVVVSHVMEVVNDMGRVLEVAEGLGRLYVGSGGDRDLCGGSYG